MAAEFPPTILVVDDNRLVQELIRDTFVEAGFAVLTASNGREALERVSEERPDVIVTDVAMPSMDGWALCEALKSDPHTRDVPLVFLAGEREVHHRLRGLRMGAYDYLCKPFSTEELLLRVRLILERVGRGGASGETPRSYLAGHTSHLPMPDLLQMLSVNGKTGCLRLRGHELGRIHFRDGRIVGAFTAKTQGRKALFRMMAWQDTDFHFDPMDDPAVDEAIEGNTQRLLMDAMVALDDQERMRPQLPPPTTPLGLAEGARELLKKRDELGDLQVKVLREAHGKASLRQMMDRIDAVDVEIARTVVEMLERGAIAPLPGAAETGS